MDAVFLLVLTEERDIHSGFGSWSSIFVALSSPRVERA